MAPIIITRIMTMAMMIFFLRNQCLFEPGFFLEGLLLGLFVLPNDRKCCLDVRGGG